MTTPPARPHRGEPHAHAHHIADACADAWFRAHGSGHTEIALSTVAALAFIRPPDADARTKITTTVAAASPEQVAEIITAQWRIYLNARPDLATPIWPLMAPWFGEHGPSTTALKAAKATAQAALNAGLHDIHPHDADLLGPLLTLLRASRDAQARGQYHTPAPVASIMARILDVPGEGASVHEPACGTGAMLRAQAEAMREEGRDPATVTWMAVDIDPVAVACLAANTVLWGLGPRVLLGVGNSLTDDWITVVHAQRQETTDLARQIRQVQALQALTSTDGGHTPEEPDPHKQPPTATPPEDPAPGEEAGAAGHTGRWEPTMLF